MQQHPNITVAQVMSDISMAMDSNGSTSTEGDIELGIGLSSNPINISEDSDLEVRRRDPDFQSN